MENSSPFTRGGTNVQEGVHLRAPAITISGCFMRKALRTFVLVLAVFFFTAPVRAQEPKRVVVAAASDLTFALKAIAASFEKDTGCAVIMSFGSTGMLAMQIEAGAPFDAFFSASLKHIEDLEKKGGVIPGTAGPYAAGRIVLAVNKASGVKAGRIKDLLKPDIKKIAIANPEHAPYGLAAMEALKAEGLWDRLGGKMVFGENIRQTLQYVQSGNAQAGIIALSIADVPEIGYSEIDPALYSPIAQSAAVVRGAKNEAAALEFIKYVKGPKGRAVLKKYGFFVP